MQTHDFQSANSDVLSLLGLDAVTIDPAKIAQILQKALIAQNGKIRPLSWISAQNDVVQKFFKHPLISNAITGTSGQKYRQVVPALSPVGLVWPENNRMFDLRIKVSAATRFLCAAAATVLEGNFVQWLPALFLDRYRGAMYIDMCARGIALPAKYFETQTLFSRFDAVMDKNGGVTLVDITFQSGGVDITGILTEEFDREFGATGFYDFKWKLLAKRLPHRLCIIGGSPVRTYAPEKLAEAGIDITAVVPTGRLPDWQVRYDSLDSDLFKWLDDPKEMKAPFDSDTQLAFWWDGLSLTTSNLARRSMQILKAIGEERINAMNHPIFVKTVESKALPVLALLPGAVHDILKSKLGQSTWDEVAMAFPQRILLEITNRRNQLHVKVARETTWQYPGVIWENLGRIKNWQQILDLLKIGCESGMLKPANGMGAAGISEIRTGVIENPRQDSGFYVLEPLIDSARMGIPNPLEKMSFTKPVIPRVEIYTATQKTPKGISADLAKILFMFNPSREDHRVHGSSGCVIMPVGVNDF